MMIFFKGGGRGADWWVTCFLVCATRQRWPKEGMLPDPTAGIMLLIGQIPSAVREYKGCCQHQLMLVIGQRPPAVRG